MTSAEELWSRVAPAVRQQLSDRVWDIWFAGLRPIAVRDGHLVLGAPNPMAVERIRNMYLGVLDDAIRSLAGANYEAQLVVDTVARPTSEPVEPAPSANREVAVIDLPALEAVPATPPAAGPASRDADPEIVSGALHERYTFDQFVIGTSNRFAHAAALAVAEHPARSYNPLFIYGPAGLGKTHLLHAIGHHVRALYATKVVRYVSTETMMNEFIDAMRAKAMPSFKRRYREVDVLLIDDIQFLERTEQLQEEFFHTFNDLHSRGSQIVISSDRPPKSIATIEERLRSRFEWGLTTDIQPPEFETRLAILKKKAEAEFLENIPDEVLHFIADHVTDNVRMLEGSLTRIAAYSSLNRVALDLDTAKAVLADLLPATQPRVVTPELILNETASMFTVALEDLTGPRRLKPLVHARQISMYVFREVTDYSYPQIAKEFGGRDHTTVMHACEKIRTQMAEKPAVFSQVNELINRIKHGAHGG